MNMNDMMNSAKGMMDKSSGDNAEGTESGGLSGIMDMAKDFDMETLEKYKSMSKTELMEELKNSEHSEKVISLIKGLVSSKSDS